MPLVLEPFADAELVLCRAQQLWLVFGVLKALEAHCQPNSRHTKPLEVPYIVQNEQNLALS